MRFIGLSVLAMLCRVSLLHAGLSFDIPAVPNVTIDGDAADWADRGLAVDVLTNPAGRLFDPKDFSATARVGYDAAGLLLLVRVQDDRHDENAGDRALGANDSIELYVSDGPGSDNRYAVALASGTADRPPRCVLDDRRPGRDKMPALATAFAIKSDATGYTAELRLPWANLGLAPAKGTAVGFNLRVNDTDKGPAKSVTWFPKLNSRTSATSVHRLVLADAASPPVRVFARADYDPELAWALVTLSAGPAFDGRRVELRQNDKLIATAKLAVDPQDDSAHPSSVDARTQVRLPTPPAGQSYAGMIAVIDSRPAAQIDWPDLDDLRARKLVDLPLAFSAAILNGPTLPTVDFASPPAAQQILGNYTLKTTFYDEQYNVVTAAKMPGRYGVVVEITPANGRRTLRRFRTIYRPAKPLDLWSERDHFKLTDPEPLGLAADAGARGDFGRLAAESLDARANTDPSIAPVLFGLTRPLPAGQPWRRNVDAVSADRQWWVGMKRKLNGWDKQFSAPLDCPRPIDGKPATTLHAGTMADAGMAEDTAEKIDTLCRKWAEESKEPFGVCVVRHGVVVIDKAYGQVNGRPATTVDKFPLASVTKPIAGTAMMLLVDRDLTNLDDPVEKYLPSFAVAKPKTSATLRHLYTHTSDLTIHDDDTSHDFDERIGEYYPRLNVGRRYEYNGGGFAIGGKIIEAVSGEALPAYYLKHLLGPLKMDHTDLVGSAADCMTTAGDLATFGQMLLSGGAYGSMRFLKAETVEAMKPVVLTKTLGPGATDRRGIGLDGGNADSQLGPQTFGHSGATSSLLRMSPDKDLVLTMVRNNAGTAFDASLFALQKTIVDSIKP